MRGGGGLNTTAKTLVGGINELNTKFANYLPLTGGTLSGSITAPILNGHLSNGAAYPRGKTDLPYHEVLTWNSKVTSAQINTCLSLMVSQFYQETDAGILEIRCRWEAGSTSPSWYTGRWISRDSTVTDNSRFILTWKYDSSTGIATLKLYCKITGWTSYNFTKISEHDWGTSRNLWTFNSALYSNAYTVASIPSNETQSNPIMENNLYKTSEIDTNDKWIDGSHIYRKVFQFSTSTVSNSPGTIGNVNVGTNIRLFLRFDVCVIGNGGNNMEVNKYIVPGRYTKSTGLYSLECTSGYSTNSIIVIAEYIK